MADVRALLRQQRSARRIDHPHAVYSESGKLSCSICREPVRLESAWDDHVRSQLHRTSVTKLRAQAQAQAQPANALGLTDNTGNGNAHKRRRSDVMEDDGDVEMGSDGDDERGKKRTRSEAPPASAPTSAPATNTSKPQIQIQVPDTQASQSKATSANANGDTRKASARLTPPLGRRSSGTPVHGVEMRIPSRPATPITNKDMFMSGSAFGGASSNSTGGSGLVSSTSTPKIGLLGRSPLIPQSDSDISKIASSASAVTSATAALSAATSSPAPEPSNSTPAAAALAQVDEDEWAAFEAEVVNAPAIAATAAASKPDFSGAAVITGAAVSADGTLADNGEETTRREAEEAKLVDEREEATRALEDEFEDMHELESRVRKLKEKREALRSQPAGSNTVTAAVAAAVAPTVAPASTEDVRRTSGTMIDKENIRQQLAAAQKGSAIGKGEPAIAEEDDDDDDDDEDADWDAFRFKA